MAEVQNFTSVPICRKRRLNGMAEAEGAGEKSGVYPMIPMFQNNASQNIELPSKHGNTMEIHEPARF